METFNVHEAKTHLSRLLERVRAGEELILAKNGVPYARLCPLEPPARRRPGLLEGTVDDEPFDPLPAEELAGWNEIAEERMPYVLLHGTRPRAVLVPYADFLRFKHLEERDVLSRFERLKQKMARASDELSDEEVAAEVEAARDEIDA